MANSSRPDRSFWIIISVALLGGLAAGILGEIFTRTYLVSDFSAFSSNVNLSNLNANNSGLIIPNAKTVVVNQDVKTAEAINNIRPVLISIFKALPAGATSTATTGSKLGYYPLDQPLFIGLIITSDGWVAALAPSDIKTNFKEQNYVAIGSDRQTYKIDKVKDFSALPGNLLVFHLAGATNLSVKKIIARSDLSLGESLLIIHGLNTAQPTTLVSLTRGSEILNSDTLNAGLILTDSSSSNLANSFVFDLAGNLAAVILDNQQIVPAFSYNAAWSNLSQKTLSQAPYLGVNYLDLSLIKTTALTADKGAWLFASSTQPAVVKGSPAQQAGLQAGDIITWVNNQQIDANDDLGDVLATYNAGDTVTLVYTRAGAEKTVNVKLGALK
jgi:hypothetical protein